MNINDLPDEMILEILEKLPPRGATTHVKLLWTIQDMEQRDHNKIHVIPNGFCWRQIKRRLSGYVRTSARSTHFT